MIDSSAIRVILETNSANGRILGGSSVGLSDLEGKGGSQGFLSVQEVWLWNSARHGISDPL